MDPTILMDLIILLIFTTAKLGPQFHAVSEVILAKQLIVYHSMTCTIVRTCYQYDYHITTACKHLTQLTTFQMLHSMALLIAAMIM